MSSIVTSVCPHQKQHSENSSRQCIGVQGEAAVQRYCESHGWEVLARNWRGGAGELDLVIRDRGVIAAVEVKTRLSQIYGSPLHAITVQKLRRIRRLLINWLAENDHRYSSLRIDVAAVTVAALGEPKIEYVTGVSA